MINYIKTKVLVLGAGPGGYTAAFRCSDLNMDTVLVEKNEQLGGICLNYGCIPSKSLLYFSKTINNINNFYNYGIIKEKINFFDINNLNIWKNRIISQLSKGLVKLSKLRNVKIIYGFGVFINKNSLKIKDSNIIIEFEFAIISTGSESISLKGIKFSKNIWNSNKALEIPFIPKNLLIIGGGIIGIEMATIYKYLGSKINILETNKDILSNLDQDLIDTFYYATKDKFKIFKNVTILNIEQIENEVNVIFKDKINNKEYNNIYDAVLISIGRYPNTLNIGLENIFINLDNKNFIIVDNNMKTNINNIYAIGDITGQPMLAHKAIHEGKVAAESIYYNNKNKNIINLIPSIMYSDPEISYVGINENYAIKNNIYYNVSKFNWNALGKAIINNSCYGFTKLIFNSNNIIIGGSIIGKDCSEIIGEISIAIEMNCCYEDISYIIHSHPTLYESIGLSASIINKTITEVLNNFVKKK